MFISLMIFLNYKYSFSYVFNFVIWEIFFKMIKYYGKMVSLQQSFSAKKYFMSIFLISPKQVFHSASYNVW